MLSYEIDVWGRIRRNVEATTASAQASAADLETARLSIHAELAVNYFTLHGLDAQRQLLDFAITAFEKALELTTNRYNQGVASQVEVLQARTQLEITRAQAIEVGVQRAQFEHAIAILLGKPPAEFSIPPSPITVIPPVIPIGLPSELLERRPDIAAAERRMAAANAQIGIAQAAFYPTVTLRGTVGLESSNLTNLFSWPSAHLVSRRLTGANRLRWRSTSSADRAGPGVLRCHRGDPIARLFSSPSRMSKITYRPCAFSRRKRNNRPKQSRRQKQHCS